MSIADNYPFEEKARELGALVAEKNRAYGSSFEKTESFLRLLYPHGIRPDQYGDALCLVRIYDKLQRIAKDKDAFGESPYKDIMGYGLLGNMMHEHRKKEGVSDADTDWLNSAEFEEAVDAIYRLEKNDADYITLLSGLKELIRVHWLEITPNS